MEIKEALRVYYNSHPEWEQRRFELIKGFAITEDHAHMVKNDFHYIHDLNELLNLADKVLSSINTEIAEILNSK